MIALIQVIWRWLQLLTLTFIYAAVFGVLVAIGDWAFGAYLPTLFSAERTSYLSNLFSEFFGMVMTVVIVDRLNAHRMQRELAEELLVQAGSRSNAFALYAIDRLRAERWLTGYGGRLRRACLQGANLQGANLFCANLRHANLMGANLVDADLRYANLECALLANTDLTGATLTGAKLPPNHRLAGQTKPTPIPRNSATFDSPVEPDDRRTRRQHRSDR